MLKVNELLKFSHDRDADFAKSCGDLGKAIDKFAGQEELSEWYSYFEKMYGLPENVVRQQVKRHIERFYDYKMTGFIGKIFPGRPFFSAIRHILALVYMLVFSRMYRSRPRQYELIADWIAADDEYMRFNNLMSLFGRDKCLAVTVKRIGAAFGPTALRPTGRAYDVKIVLGTIRKEICGGIWINLKTMAVTGINVFALSGHVLNQYLYYSSLFRNNRAKYCIQERHYQTSAIKNHLFQKYGGRYSCTLQKNIYQLGSCGFYYDADILFSLGRRTMERAFGSGARIGEVVPAGSMFMEYHWFTDRGSYELPEDAYDIVYLGVNFYGSNRLDAYSTFVDDYYEAYRWLVRLSKERPELKIAVIHHPNYRGYGPENELLSGTNIHRLEHCANSYDAAFRSGCPVTFCSTMGYELIAHGKHAVFMDPGRRDTEILPEDGMIDPWRAVSYEDFVEKTKNIIEGRFNPPSGFCSEDLCMDSMAVSKRIYGRLTGAKEKNEGK
ncbi:MAG: hypothetical protein PHQ61_05645 [Candidatus Omnitrophica bacterium]|nr:hypothetical protein [Candidatus Omnitrophota bacterium]